LKAGSLNGARGMIAPTGRLEPMPDLAALVAREAATAAPVSRVRGSRPRAA
jgi:hypothetical protein